MSIRLNTHTVVMFRGKPGEEYDGEYLRSELLDTLNRLDEEFTELGHSIKDIGDKRVCTKCSLMMTHKTTEPLDGYVNVVVQVTSNPNIPDCIIS